jgi:GNAT superfamily N-acetyltransferase
LSKVIARSFQEDDLNFILASWLNCYRFNSPITSRIRSSIYYKEHQEKIIDRLLKKASVGIHIAQLDDDPVTILGYIIVEKPFIHFVYVKKSCRGEGIAKFLLKSAGFDIAQPLEFSHYTYEIDSIRNKYPNLYFNPYILQEGVKSDKSQ